MNSLKLISVLLASSILFVAQNVSAIDVKLVNKIANDTIKQINYGVVGDIDTVIAMQEQLIVIGMEAGLEFIQDNPQEARALMLVIENAEQMKGLSLEEIEDVWHSGEYLRSKGFEPDSIDHFSPTNSLMGSVIHPATSYLLISEYKQTGNTELLARAKGELVEMIEHFKHVNKPSDMPMQMQVTQDH